MEIVNQTAFQLAWIAGRMCFPGHSLTFVVKATYRLRHGNKVNVAEEQLFPTGDEYYPDDENRQGSIRYASDFAYFKPKADLFVIGKCHQPGGNPSPTCTVTFKIGSRAKSLVVTGDRFRKGMLSTLSSDPEPFSHMDLRYENSYGGKGYLKNPVGKGYYRGEEEKESGEKMHWLPNILHPGDKPDMPWLHPEPTGFGPLAQTWEQRSSKLGTYKGKYLEERWPWFPEDFDWTYFNAAPADMQVDGYLRGDEKLFFQNLHPDHDQYESQLPGVRPRCFVNRFDGSGTGSLVLEEVLLEMDTLWVDLESETLVLVWRGWTRTASEELEDVNAVFVISESLQGPQKTMDECRALFHESLPATEEVAKTPSESNESPVDIDKEISKAEEESKAQLVAAGLDPDSPPAPSEEEKEREREILKEIGFEEEESEKSPLTRQLVLELFKQGKSFAGKDLSAMDLSKVSLAGIDLRGTILTGTILSDSNLSGADLTGAAMSGVDLSGADLSNASLGEADLTASNLREANLTGAILNDAVLSDAALHNATLERVTAEDVFFSAADLRNANLKDSTLRRADLSYCILNDADFRGADLTDASVEGAKGHRMNMEKANLTQLRASEGCDFTQSSFRETLAPESIWENGNLTGADFSFSHMEGADFTSACLQRANLSAANLKFARFIKADLKESNLAEANLFEGSLRRADLSRADLHESNLYGVEFLDSVLVGTVLDGANIKMTKLARK